ncbi:MULTISPECIES: DUF998 domain-containing protein [unclassified Rathayibacter]|uniref:DUF998 domain-containing protein n=1 Tax=unclassified Rathayibacter TaxID=2609250 RepID=UPI0006F8B15B|nr:MULTISPECIES: DUF998 domain-containing protein [unclassified Rathayibacter]KQQ03591.1 hypothetical protein ASF42_08835 [Rathayibacter sp. Leaf294]KQS12047.1 hypothetical protein ASG06_08835 [Rathayibacter sp. Leaf185]
MTTPRRLRTIAGLLWIVGPLVYLGAEAVAASAFPGYSYAENYISDLGVPEVGAYEGRAIDSPLHAVMNAGFVIEGVLFLAAALTTVRASSGGPRWAFLALAAAHSVGIALVGLVHGSRQSLENGTAGIHVLGAALAIIGGNLAAITAGVTVLRSRTRWAPGTVGIVLGTVGLLGLVLLRVDSGSTALDLLPDGVWERVAVYTVTAWQLVTGTLLLAGGPSPSPR